MCLWNSSLIIPRNPASGSVLKIIYNVESEIISTNFLYSVPVKSVALFCTLIGSVFQNDSVTSHVGHLENRGSLSCAHLPGIDTFHYTIFRKPQALMSPPVSSRSLVSPGKLELSLWITGESFQKLIGNRYNELFSLKGQAHLDHFWKPFCHVPKPTWCVCMCVCMCVWVYIEHVKYSIVVQHLHIR